MILYFAEEIHIKDILFFILKNLKHVYYKKFNKQVNYVVSQKHKVIGMYARIT